MTTKTQHPTTIALSHIEMKPRSWHGWTYNPRTRTLRHPASPYVYTIPLPPVRTATEIVCWMNHMEQKEWITDVMLRGLFVALFELRTRRA